jgi:amino acid transporter
MSSVSLIIGRTWSKMFLRKPRAVCLDEENESKLERTLSLFDLLCIGIGGTVGSGVFVLTGLIAHDYAGAGVIWSWAIAGFGCAFSAMSYAEMSCRIPSAGSSYAYVYYALGEMPAVVAAWCLTLEYGIRYKITVNTYYTCSYLTHIVA